VEEEKNLAESETRKVLSVRNLHKYFPGKKQGQVCAVNGISFSLARGKTLGLVGESGCGKTTAGRCILHLIEPTKGEIVFLGTDIGELPEKDFKAYRPRIQMVFQEPYDSLNPRKKIRQTIEDPLVLEGRLGRGERKERVRVVLEMMRLRTECIEKYPIELTQGEQQRVGIGRAIATNPDLLVLDEPTSLLDVSFRAEVIDLLITLQKKLGVAYLFISHDLTAVRQISHRVAVMYLGRIVEESSVHEVFDSPLHPYTRALLTAALFPDPKQERSGFRLKGEVPSPINLSDDRCNFAPRCPLAEDRCFERMPELKKVSANHSFACFKAF